MLAILAPVDFAAIIRRYPLNTIEGAFASELPDKVPTLCQRLTSQYPEYFRFGDWDGTHFLQPFIYGGVNGSSEMGITSRDDRWIGFIRSLIPGVEISRDQHDTSSGGTFRPDCTLAINGAMFLKAEAKALDSEISIAVCELTEKFAKDAVQLFPGNSILGLVSSVHVIEIHVITFHSETYSTTLLKRYDLEFEIQKVLFIVDIVKLMRWTVSIVKPNRRFHLMPGVRKLTTNRHHITWIKDGLFKQFNKSVTPEVINRIGFVYQQAHPNVEWGVVKGDRSILITRIGLRIQTAIHEGLISKERVIEDIRCAMDWLHSVGLAHCDIALRNVFFDSASKQAFLDDLEHLTPISDHPPHTNWFKRRPKTAGDLDLIQISKFNDSVYEA